MGHSKLPEDFEIAPGYSVGAWKRLGFDEAAHDSEAVVEAIKILDTRIRSRFLNPIQCLIDSEKDKKRATFGFAILALDFLLIETIQGFKEGRLNHLGHSRKLFVAFLGAWEAFASCLTPNANAMTLAGQIYDQGRCALHHTGSTDRIRVMKSGLMFVFYPDGRIEINRSLLHRKLTEAFEAYLAELKIAGNAKLRKNLKAKMDHICGT